MANLLFVLYCIVLEQSQTWSHVKKKKEKKEKWAQLNSSRVGESWGKSGATVGHMVHRLRAQQSDFGEFPVGYVIRISR